MKLLFDHNLSYKLIQCLGSLYPGSKHVRQIGLSMASDTTVWNFARENDLIIVSKDWDFYSRSILFGHPPKVIWVRLGNCKTAQVETLLRWKHEHLVDFVKDTTASFLILP